MSDLIYSLMDVEPCLVIQVYLNLKSQTSFLRSLLIHSSVLDTNVPCSMFQLPSFPY